MRGDGLVTLSSVRLPAGKELPGSERGQLWLWARPLHRGHEAAAAAARVPLSAEASCLSFAHLLALLLDGRHLAVGGMSLQRDFVRYLVRAPGRGGVRMPAVAAQVLVPQLHCELGQPVQPPASSPRCRCHPGRGCHRALPALQPRGALLGTAATTPAGTSGAA